MSGAKERSSTLEIPEGKLVLSPLFGPQDSFRRLLERRLTVKLSARGRKLTISGSSEKREFAGRVLEELVTRVRTGTTLFIHDIDHLISLLDGAEEVDFNALRAPKNRLDGGQQSVIAKSPNQAAYLAAMRDKDLVFATGPAGTGKTYLAMAAAVAALRNQEVERIVLARPAVEAGERLGFLPGSLVDKVNPYLRPLHDALFDLMGFEPATKLIESGVAEVAPLAFMRGRTLNRAFVILDEAQNTTREQMKMFLTRLGFGSRAVVTGDITQIDLERGQQSGLVHVLKILDGIPEIGMARLTPIDVVRHPLVRAIVRAYDAADQERRRRG